VGPSKNCLAEAHTHTHTCVMMTMLLDGYRDTRLRRVGITVLIRRQAPRTTPMLSLLSSLPEDAQSYFARFHIDVRTVFLFGVSPGRFSRSGYHNIFIYLFPELGMQQYKQQNSRVHNTIYAYMHTKGRICRHLHSTNKIKHNMKCI